MRKVTLVRSSFRCRPPKASRIEPSLSRRREFAMNRPVLALVCVLVFHCPNVLGQTAPATVKVADVTWREVIDRQGNRVTVPVFAVSGPNRPSTRVTFVELEGVVGVDERWRVAKLANDLQAMEQILSTDF